MSDPFEILGVSLDADDAAVRNRYLELVRAHPPERDPKKFSEIRAAYEQVKDVETRLARRLFETPRSPTFDDVIAELMKSRPRSRFSLARLVEWSKPK